MAISVLNEEKIFKLDAGSSSYVMAVMGGGRLIHLYYGARISDSRVKFLAQERGVASFWAIPAGEADEFSTDVMPMEYSGAGTADLRPAAIASVDEEGDNVTDLLFDSYQVIEGKPDYPGLPHTYLNDGDGAQTLKITPARQGKGSLRGSLLHRVRLLRRDRPLDGDPQRGQAGGEAHPRDERLPAIPG